MPTLGTYRHLVQVSGRGAPVPDGEGGWTEANAPLDPPLWHCSIAPANAKDLESIGAGTVLSQATHIVKGRYHRGLTTQASLQFEGRTLNVIFVVNVDERDRESNVVCAEVVE